MTSRITAAIAAGFLAIGILVGAAGAVLVRDATTPDWSDHMGRTPGMMAMMGGGWMMGAAPMSPWNHALHHPGATPGAPR